VKLAIAALTQCGKGLKAIKYHRGDKNNYGLGKIYMLINYTLNKTSLLFMVLSTDCGDRQASKGKHQGILQRENMPCAKRLLIKEHAFGSDTAISLALKHQRNEGPEGMAEPMVIAAM